MKETKEQILDVSLDLFSQKGYSAVSIRDICNQIKIKESSIYYHFKNKQAIFDEIIERFQKIACGMMRELEHRLTENQEELADNFYQTVCDYFFEEYLMNDFCNKVMRLMLLEQFHNEEIMRTYHDWMFSEPLKFQSSIFQMLMKLGVLPETDSDYLAIKYYSPIFLFASQWLFHGTLSEQNKEAFRKNAYQHIQLFFSELGGN